MPEFSAASIAQLSTAHPDLQRLFREVIKHLDVKVLQGHRSVADQQELYAQGRTKPGNIVTNIDGVRRKSKHNHNPSLAVDVVPWPIDWKDIGRFQYMGGFVLGFARAMGIDVEWGGHWKTFKDLPHFELREP